MLCYVNSNNLIMTWTFDNFLHLFKREGSVCIYLVTGHNLCNLLLVMVMWSTGSSCLIILGAVLLVICTMKRRCLKYPMYDGDFDITSYHVLVLVVAFKNEVSVCLVTFAFIG